MSDQWLPLSSSAWLIIGGLQMLAGYAFGRWMEARRAARQLAALEQELEELRGAEPS